MLSDPVSLLPALSLLYLLPQRSEGTEARRIVCVVFALHHGAGKPPRLGAMAGGGLLSSHIVISARTGAGNEKAQGWCYRPGLFINSFLYRFSSFSNNQSRLFCKGRYMSCVLIYYFVEQIFAENIPCLGPWCRGAGKKAVRADETSLWLTQCLGVNEPRGMALNGIR